MWYYLINSFGINTVYSFKFYQSTHLQSNTRKRENLIYFVYNNKPNQTRKFEPWKFCPFYPIN